jgi:hypothetical protein
MHWVSATQSSAVRPACCRKCLAKGIEVKDLRDVAQLRVVLHPHTGAGSAPWPGTGDKQLCYHVMGLVSNLLAVQCLHLLIITVQWCPTIAPAAPLLWTPGSRQQLAVNHSVWC